MTFCSLVLHPWGVQAVGVAFEGEWTIEMNEKGRGNVSQCIRFSHLNGVALFLVTTAALCCTGRPNLA